MKKRSNMNFRKLLLLQLFLVFGANLFAQQGMIVKYMPAKYERVSIGQDVGMTKVNSSLYWVVTVINEETQVFQDKSLSTPSMSQVQFIDRFWVADETAEALLLIGSKSDNIPYENGVFNEDAKKIGWIKKEDLLLWEFPLINNNIALKVILKNDLTFGEQGDVYSVYKKKGSQYLLSESSLVTKMSNLFWVGAEDLFTLNYRTCYAPKDNIEEFEVYRSLSDFQNQSNSQSKELDLSYGLNDLFFLDSSQADSKTYTHCSQDGLKPAFLDFKVMDEGLALDYLEKLALGEFVNQILSSGSAKDLEAKIKRLMSKKKIQGGSLLDICSAYTGLNLSNEKAFSKDSINQIPYGTLSQLQKNLQVLLDDLNKPYSNYANGNGQSLYVLRQDLFPAKIMDAYMLSGENMTPPSSMKGALTELNSFDLFYFDCSDSNLSFDDKKSLQFYYSNRVFKLESDKKAHLLFYSDGLDAISGEGVAKMDEISSVLFAKTTTYYPVSSDDKRDLENMILNKIAKVKNDINLHFFLSTQLIKDINSKRPLLIQELPERLTTLMGGAKVNVNIKTLKPEDKSLLDQMILKGRLSKNTKINYKVDLLN